MTMPPSANALPERPLAETIAVATRASHTRLNRSIIARLPLVAQASDPSSYITGLLHIAPIYLTFEALWQTILDTPPAQDEVLKDASGLATTSLHDGDGSGTPTTSLAALQMRKPVVCDRLRTLLQQLRLPGLMRAARLRADIRTLTGWSEDVVEEQLRLTGETGRLGEFTAHIKRSVEHRPHVLVAYSYILYMALFAGGRFIRATLESTGDAYWNQTPSPVKPSMLECKRESSDSASTLRQPSEAGISPTTTMLNDAHGTPLSFFHFATPEDGEDLKREFKAQLLSAEDVISPQEKHDIVQESICIFDNMELLVGQLDRVCAEDEEGANAASMANLAALMGKSMAMRLRDSVAVTKDRAARSSSRMSSSSDSGSLNSAVKGRKAHGTAATSTGFSSAGGPGHPPVPATAAAMELCPAMKSMRFETEHKVPLRASPSGSDGVQGVHYTNWLLMAAFGAIVIGAIMTTRREMVAV